jgi:hypothetical protein
VLDKKYNIKLDLQFRCNNQTMKFNQFDNNTSDFFIKISNSGKDFDIEKVMVVLASIKPSGKVSSQFIEVNNGVVYADLKPNMVDEIGVYTAQAMLILEDERVVTDIITYEVNESNIISAFIEDIETQEDYSLLTDMLSRLSSIEISEEQRMINEAERILAEENRKIEEAKRVEAELIRQHEEADRAKYDATREGNENIRKLNEDLRKSNENIRLENETKRVEEENKRKLAEEERNANYNFMVEDEERRRVEANTHKEAENLRVQAENNRVNEENKRRTTEQSRVLAENTRVSNENTRKSNEETRKSNENKRIEAETKRQNRYNTFIVNAEYNANTFKNYTDNAKVDEEERISNETDRKSQENRRVLNETERISNENLRKYNEISRENNETSRQSTFNNKISEVNKKISEIDSTKNSFTSSINTKVDSKISEIETAKSDLTNTVFNKINEVENRFNNLTSKQQQDSEVIDARLDFKGQSFSSLKERIDYTDKILRDSTVSTVETESSFTTVDATSNGYFEDVKLEGKTLVNHLCNSENTISSTNATAKSYVGLQVGKTYTVVVNVIENNNNKAFHPFRITYSDNSQTNIPSSAYPKGSVITYKFELADKGINFLWVNWCASYVEGDIITTKTLLLEGDHTNNPPEYFEGLLSVGQDVEEVSVASVSDNILDIRNTEMKLISSSENIPTNARILTDNEIYYKGKYGVFFNVYLPKGTFNIGFSKEVISGDNNSTTIRVYREGDLSKVLASGVNTTQLTSEGAKYSVCFYGSMGIEVECKLYNLYINACNVHHIEHQSNKKPLLYYNPTTETWEKPILREWDSIEKHSDGKYYYHKRSGEVVINGSEHWTQSWQNVSTNTCTFEGFAPQPSLKNNQSATSTLLPLILCDKINPTPFGNMWQHGSVMDRKDAITTYTGNKFVVVISKSKLSTQDVAGFKAWLKDNPTTVVYELAQEEVYECTNIDLMTYSGKTNYIVSSGIISPKSILKVHNNISNVVKILQEKVSLLESNIKTSQEIQDMMILESDIKILDMELALMEHMPIKLNLGENSILRSLTYFNFLKNHIINETYSKDYLESVMSKYLVTNRLTKDEYDELYKILYPQNSNIELPIEY